jgi:Putative adhesin
MTKSLPMTPARRVALAIGAPIALLIIGWTALTAVAWAGQASYRVHLRIHVRSHALTLAVNSGQVSLRGGSTGIVRVTGTAHYSLVRPRVHWQSTSSGTSIRSTCEALTGPCSLDFAVTMPAGLTTDVSDDSGDLAASGLHGRVTLRAQSGNIEASAMTADVLLSDQSGDINAAGLSGQSVIIKDQSGNITAAGLTNPAMTVTDQSGDITLTFASVPARVQVTCDSGDVRLVLPSGSTAYRVDAHTSSGSTSVRVPTASFSPHVITVTDQSGDITITR